MPDGRRTVTGRAARPGGRRPVAALPAPVAAARSSPPAPVVLTAPAQTQRNQGSGEPRDKPPPAAPGTHPLPPPSLSRLPTPTRPH
ncbi:hypothetical protein GCM10027075_12380 [Streptomyces heilongjiangensis]